MFEYPGEWKTAENYVDAFQEYERICDLQMKGEILEKIEFNQVQQFLPNFSQNLPEKIQLEPHVFQGLFAGEYGSFGDPDLSGDQTEANRVSFCLQFDLKEDLKFSVKF